DSPCFSSYWFGALRALPSFPTRRSSDLRPVVDERLALIADAFSLPSSDIKGAADAVLKRADALIAAASLPTRLRDVGVPAEELRSEEHTSELQSRENLVCRLLLEKKK